MIATLSESFQTVIYAILLVAYFVPWLIARDTYRSSVIFILNLVFGWTVIGWFVVLACAVNERYYVTR